MPIYEFSCLECHRDFERLLRSSNWNGTACPKCGSTRISKKFSVFASHATGSNGGDIPPCSNNPRSCGRCGTGTPHSH